MSDGYNKCKFCVSSKQDGYPLMTFDETKQLEGYIYVDKKGILIVSNDYGNSEKRINFCPICGNEFNQNYSNKKTQRNHKLHKG